MTLRQGTLEYAAPESFDLDSDGHLKEQGREADLWALGPLIPRAFTLSIADEEANQA